MRRQAIHLKSRERLGELGHFCFEASYKFFTHEKKLLNRFSNTETFNVYTAVISAHTNISENQEKMFSKGTYFDPTLFRDWESRAMQMGELGHRKQT